MVVCESGKREERSDELMERCEEKKNINRRTGDEESGRREESRAEGKEREGVWPPALVHNISRTRTARTIFKLVYYFFATTEGAGALVTGRLTTPARPAR